MAAHSAGSAPPSPSLGAESSDSDGEFAHLGAVCLPTSTCSRRKNEELERLQKECAKWSPVAPNIDEMNKRGIGGVDLSGIWAWDGRIFTTNDRAASAAAAAATPAGEPHPALPPSKMVPLTGKKDGRPAQIPSDGSRKSTAGAAAPSNTVERAGEAIGSMKTAESHKHPAEKGSLGKAPMQVALQRTNGNKRDAQQMDGCGSDDASSHRRVKCPMREDVFRDRSNRSGSSEAKQTVDVAGCLALSPLANRSRGRLRPHHPTEREGGTIKARNCKDILDAPRQPLQPHAPASTIAAAGDSAPVDELAEAEGAKTGEKAVVGSVEGEEASSKMAAEVDVDDNTEGKDAEKGHRGKTDDDGRPRRKEDAIALAVGNMANAKMGKSSSGNSQKASATGEEVGATEEGKGRGCVAVTAKKPPHIDRAGAEATPEAVAEAVAVTITEAAGPGEKVRDEAEAKACTSAISGIKDKSDDRPGSCSNLGGGEEEDEDEASFSRASDDSFAGFDGDETGIEKDEGDPVAMAHGKENEASTSPPHRQKSSRSKAEMGKSSSRSSQKASATEDKFSATEGGKGRGCVTVAAKKPSHVDRAAAEAAAVTITEAAGPGEKVGGEVAAKARATAETGDAPPAVALSETERRKQEKRKKENRRRRKRKKPKAAIETRKFDDVLLTLPATKLSTCEDPGKVPRRFRERLRTTQAILLVEKVREKGMLGSIDFDDIIEEIGLEQIVEFLNLDIPANDQGLSREYVKSIVDDLRTICEQKAHLSSLTGAADFIMRCLFESPMDQDLSQFYNKTAFGLRIDKRHNMLQISFLDNIRRWFDFHPMDARKIELDGSLIRNGIMHLLTTNLSVHHFPPGARGVDEELVLSVEDKDARCLKQCLLKLPETHLSPDDKKRFLVMFEKHAINFQTLTHELLDKYIKTIVLRGLRGNLEQHAMSKKVMLATFESHPRTHCVIINGKTDKIVDPDDAFGTFKRQMVTRSKKVEDFKELYEVVQIPLNAENRKKLNQEVLGDRFEG